jgi:alkylation response protein AidB-like acyl-CoA dehydrogenase
MGTLTHETAVSRAREIADRVLAPLAAQNDKAGRFSTEAVDGLGREELLGLMVPTEAGGSGLGPRTFAAVIATLAEADASVAMISVTSAAMRTRGGAAFSKNMSIERLFRDAHAGAVMAPTGDVLREFIARTVLGMPLF